MSWLSSSFTDYAKHALTQAQASIDAALEIQPEQDPLADNKPSSSTNVPRTTRPRPKSGPTNKPKTSTPNSKTGPANAQDWSTWGNATVNNLWDSTQSSFNKPAEEDPRERKTSNALKLGGPRKSRSPTKQITRKKSDQKTPPPLLLPMPPSNTEPPQPNQHTEETPRPLPHEQSNNKNVPLDSSSSSITLTPTESDTKGDDTKEKEPLTPTLSACSSSSALDRSVLIKSTSSTSSQSTIASTITNAENPDTAKPELTVDVVEEVSYTSIVAEDPGSLDPGSLDPGSLDPGSMDKSGWSEDDDLELEKSDQEDSQEEEETSRDSRDSRDNTGHKRVLSIGSTASSSILMLNSPSDTNTSDTNGDRSDKSDEDNSHSAKTPTNCLLSSTSVSLKHDPLIPPQTISEEKCPEKKALKRVITSPTHSEQSDLVVLSEERTSPSNVPNLNKADEVLKLKEILHAREQRLFTMNKEYADIHDELQYERQRSHELQQNLSILSNKHQFTVQELQDELGTVEELKNHIEEELQTLRSLGDMEGLIAEMREKDDLIGELTMEGEKLSQASFNSSNHVKKLRQKEKEDEKLIKDLKSKIENLNTEIEKSKNELKQASERHKENEENISELSAMINTQGEELHTLRNSVEDNDAEKAALKSNLDACYREMAGLKQDNITANTRATQESLSANLKAQEEAKEAISNVMQDSENTTKQLNSQILELQEVISRLEQQAQWKEQRHRDQIQELHQRIEDADGRNQDLSTSISASTQPLLRQIHLLQETQANQSSNWEKIERALNDKLEEARSDLSTADLHKREMSDKVQIYKNKVSALTTQIDNARTERSQLEVDIELVQNKLNLVEDERKKDSAKWENTKSGYLKSVDESRGQVTELQTELDSTRIVLEELERSKSVTTEEDVMIASRSSTPPIDIMYTSQTHILERSLGFNRETSSVSPISTSSVAHSSYAVEKLTSQLKHAQSETLAYQEQIRSLNLSKASLSTEITVLSKKVAELEHATLELPRIIKENKELQTRYDTLLQMYGEKAEEVHELQLDLTDVREAYKAQIEQLLSKVIK